MKSNNTGIWVALIAVAIIAIGGYFLPAVGSQIAGSPGGVTNYNNLGISGLKLGSTCNDSFSFNGCSASLVSKLLFAGSAPTVATLKCVLIDGSSVTASTTKANDCAVAGVQPGDTVFVQAATTTTTGAFQGWKIAGASASSTAGFVTVKLENDTGANAVPPSTATSTDVLILR